MIKWGQLVAYPCISLIICGFHCINYIWMHTKYTQTHTWTNTRTYKQARTLTRKHNVISLNMLLRDVNSKQPWDVSVYKSIIKNSNIHTHTHIHIYRRTHVVMHAYLYFHCGSDGNNQWVKGWVYVKKYNYNIPSSPQYTK